MIAVALGSANSSDGRQERQADRDLILPTSAGAMIRAQLMSEVRAKDRQRSSLAAFRRRGGKPCRTTALRPRRGPEASTRFEPPEAGS